ncbi:MAG: sigma-70 family RNA polymerase sigma factor [Acidobacteria bacterium]|nr:sigma-70 family RNA polymerase sigma factor [Acidobacteriota bacterium]
MDTLRAAETAPGTRDDEQDPALRAERELIELARLGDRDAFGRLMQAHLPRVWNVVWRIVRHEQDAEDIVQESFLAAFRALPAFRGESRFSTWLHRIAVTRALNHLDRKAERVGRSSVPLDGPAAPPVRDGAPTPLQSLERKELLRRLAECLPKLPPAWRATLALRDGDSLSYEHIADVLSLNVGTVRSRLARARAALRKCVDGEAA